MRKQRDGRNPLFAKRWFSDGVIILCVRWYLRFRLSYRDLASIAAELGITVAPSTILRWVVRYTGEFVSRWDPFELAVGRSWRADETYIKVNGGWMYLYRAVDEKGRTVASYLSRSRDQTGSKDHLSACTEASWGTPQYHTGWLRAEPQGIAGHGHAE